MCTRLSRIPQIYTLTKNIAQQRKLRYNTNIHYLNNNIFVFEPVHNQQSHQYILRPSVTVQSHTYKPFLRFVNNSGGANILSAPSITPRAPRPFLSTSKSSTQANDDTLSAVVKIVALPDSDASSPSPSWRRGGGGGFAETQKNFCG
jgi:hypothetical protein